jgi:hypothetical protein
VIEVSPESQPEDFKAWIDQVLLVPSGLPGQTKSASGTTIQARYVPASMASRAARSMAISRQSWLLNFDSSHPEMLLIKEEDSQSEAAEEG